MLRQREDDVLLDHLELLDAGDAEAAKEVGDLFDEPLGGRRAGRDGDGAHAVEPGRVDLRRLVDAVGADAVLLGDLDEDEAVALAKAAVLAAEPDWHDGLVEEAHLFQRLLRTPGAAPAMRRFLELGGQTAEGEAQVGELNRQLSR